MRVMCGRATTRLLALALALSSLELASSSSCAEFRSACEEELRLERQARRSDAVRHQRQMSEAAALIESQRLEIIKLRRGPVRRLTRADEGAASHDQASPASDADLPTSQWEPAFDPLVEMGGCGLVAMASSMGVACDDELSVSPAAAIAPGINGSLCDKCAHSCDENGQRCSGLCPNGDTGTHSESRVFFILCRRNSEDRSRAHPARRGDHSSLRSDPTALHQKRGPECAERC